MQKLKYAGITAVAISLTIGGTAIAKQPARQPMHQAQMRQRNMATSALKSSDRQFLNKTAQDSVYEFAAAQLALQKAQSNEVAQYATRLLDDHSTFNKELMQLARREGIVLPVKLDSQDSVKLERLKQLSGKEFDRRYTQEMAKDNASSIQEFQQEARTINAPAVKSFVSQFLPAQQEHYKMATALESSPRASNSYTNRTMKK